MLAANDLHVLNQMDFIVCPIMFLTGLYFTLLGFGVIRAGSPDKGREALQIKVHKMLRWAGPILMTGSAAIFIHEIIGVF